MKLRIFIYLNATIIGLLIGFCPVVAMDKKSSVLDSVIYYGKKYPGAVICGLLGSSVGIAHGLSSALTNRTLYDFSNIKNELLLSVAATAFGIAFVNNYSLPKQTTVGDPGLSNSEQYADYTKKATPRAIPRRILGALSLKYPARILSNWRLRIVSSEGPKIRDNHERVNSGGGSSSGQSNEYLPVVSPSVKQEEKCSIRYWIHYNEGPIQFQFGESPKLLLESILMKHFGSSKNALKYKLIFSNGSISRSLLTPGDINDDFFFANKQGPVYVVRSYTSNQDIYSACQKGDIGAFENIIWKNEFVDESEKVDINKHDAYGNSPLMIALCNMRYEVIKSLIWYGADTNEIIKNDLLVQEAHSKDKVNLRTGLLFLLEHLNTLQEGLSQDDLEKLDHLKKTGAKFKDPWIRYRFSVAYDFDLYSSGGRSNLMEYNKQRNFGISATADAKMAMDECDLKALKYVCSVINKFEKNKLLTYALTKIKAGTEEISKAFTEPTTTEEKHQKLKQDVGKYVDVAEYLIENCLDDIKVTGEDLEFIMQINHAYPYIFGWGQKIINFCLENGCNSYRFWQVAQQYIEQVRHRHREASTSLQQAEDNNKKRTLVKIKGEKSLDYFINLSDDEKCRFEDVCNYFHIPQLIRNKYRLVKNKNDIWELSAMHNFPSPHTFLPDYK